MRSDPYETWVLIVGAVLVFTIWRLVLANKRAGSEKALRIRAEGEKTKLQAHIEGLDKILEERKIQFPWLATAIADFEAFEAEREAKQLQTKRHPAVKAAEALRAYGKKAREAQLTARMARYRAEYYEKLFPWIVDYIGDDVPDYIVDLSGTAEEPDEDPAFHWLSPGEYEKLSNAEKYQRALDNWRRRKKTPWQVGRDYERYIGYVYETQGYDVQFTGALEGFEDMGRDVIAQRGSELFVIQCKRWSVDKVIREKHVFQLFGSALEYDYRLNDHAVSRQLSFFGTEIRLNARPVLYTSTKLSDVARAVAEKLKVQVFENVVASDYPLVKCNIGLRQGEKIYHLPFDQQYDRTKIKLERGEKYVYTVAEAERLGFRRAARWQGDQQTAAGGR